MTVMTITTVSREDSRRMKRRIEKRREREQEIACYSTPNPQPKTVSYLVTPPEDVTSGTSERYRDLIFKTKTFRFKKATIQNAKTFFFSQTEKEGLPK